MLRCCILLISIHGEPKYNFKVKKKQQRFSNENVNDSKLQTKLQRTVRKPFNIFLICLCTGKVLLKQVSQMCVH